jgi:CheY-like chemotaxis protein
VLPVPGATPEGAEAAWRDADRAEHGVVRPGAESHGGAYGAAHGRPSDPAPGAPDAAPEAEAAPVTVVAFGPDAATVAYLTRTLYPDVRLVHATDPATVADVARAEHAALVAIDVQSDDGAGWAVAHALRDHPPLDDLPLLILPATVSRAPRGLAAALDLGLVAFAPKLRAALADPDAGPDGSAEGGPGAERDPAGPLADAEFDATRLARAVGRAALGRPRAAAAAPAPRPTCW